MLYAEWCMNKPSHTATFVNTSKLDYLVGHSSVYWFNEECKSIMERKGNILGCSNFPVSSNRFIIDLDDGLTSMKTVCEQLVARGLAYDVWSTGGKGFHIIVPMPMVEDLDLPYSQEQYARGIQGVSDFNIYRHNSLIRLPNTQHEKTGKYKTKVYSREGNKLDLPILVNPKRFTTWEINEKYTDTSYLKSGVNSLYKLLLDPPPVGSRHIRLWSCAKALFNSGLEYETVLDLLTNVNDTWDTDPKDDSDIKGIVDSLYGEGYEDNE